MIFNGFLKLSIMKACDDIGNDEVHG